jgi:uracil-DNA glycosylase family 4
MFWRDVMPEPSDVDLVRQVRQHLENLRAAGVEWLPTAPPPVRRLVAKPQAAGTLFEVPVVDPVKPPSASPDDRRRELAVLATEVSTCKKCSELAAKRTQTVFGVGPVDAELCLIGEAPGGDEDRLGEPFVGAAGQLLNRILAACGFQREEVYICNTLKCRPPGNRTPKPEEITNCREYLDRQLELVKPKFICCLGGTAAQHVLATTASLGKLRGRFHDYKGIPVLCTYHPSYLLPHRDPSKKKEVWEDMQFLLKRMGRPIPKR